MKRWKRGQPRAGSNGGESNGGTAVQHSERALSRLSDNTKGDECHCQESALSDFFEPPKRALRAGWAALAWSKESAQSMSETAQAWPADAGCCSAGPLERIARAGISQGERLRSFDTALSAWGAAPGVCADAVAGQCASAGSVGTEGHDEAGEGDSGEAPSDPRAGVRVDGYAEVSACSTSSGGFVASRFGDGVNAVAIIGWVDT